MISGSKDHGKKFQSRLASSFSGIVNCESEAFSTRVLLQVSLAILGILNKV